MPRFTDIFVHRPVLALVIGAVMLLVGLQAGSQLSLREYPEVEKSVIFVRAVYPGASAETVQGFVTTPLQRRIASAKGVDYITSTSNTGVSQIEVWVRLGENSTDVMGEVITKINEARFELPREVEDPVVSNRTGGDAMMYLALLSEQMSVQQRADYAVRSIQPVLSTIEGVGEARLLGVGDFAMRIWLNPTRMAAFGVTAADVDAAVRRDNFIAAAGTTRGELVRASVDAETDLEDPERFAAIVVRQQGDRRVTLGDVATVELGSETYDAAVYSSGQATLFIAITEAPGANPLEMARRVKTKVAELNDQLPADLSIFLDSDLSIYIGEALDEVVRTLVEASVIVVLVILLFLGSLRVVAIPIVAIPLSLVSVLFLIWLMGFSINLLTLLAMVIAIGLVVDDAIVVVENVHRHIEAGEQPLAAALEGAREVAWPVVAMTLTLVAVYLPIGFLGGLTGVLFSEFALTLAGAVVISGVVALVLSPMMCAYLLKDHQHQGVVASWLDARFDELLHRYQRWLGRCLDHRGAVMLFAAIIFLSLPAFYQLAQKELAPEEDSGSIFAVATPPDYGSLEYTTYFLDQMVEAWRTVPEVTHSWQVNEPGSVFGGLELEPWRQRDRSLEEVRQEVQAKYDRISGLEIFTFAAGGLPGASSGLPVQFVISSNADYRELDRVAEEVLARVRPSGVFAFVTKDLRFSRPEVGVRIDRELAARLGISMEDIGRTLQIMLGEAETNRISIEGRSYKVIPQAGRDFRLTKEWLERYYVRAGSGSLVPLSTVIDIHQTVKPNTRKQFQQQNSVTIQGLLIPPNSLGDGLALLERTLQEVAPTGFRAGYLGESRRFVEESQGFLPLFAASMVFIYLVLAAQFNSFRDPLIVLISVPLSIFGAVVPLALGMTTLNIYTQVGLLTLIGLISKHGILIVDFANHRLREGVSRREAVLEAAGLRLRPILMTTFATVLGVVPLLMAFGAGANARFAIGLMIAAGMLVGTLFTLFVLPTFYTLMGRRQTGPAVADASPATP
ncbi:MAG: efflux RND transporter permease subunit [Pseudomonadales bacterium]|nr:efflux RND transporter permease subunit [Pseudomonadales bacterium]